MREICLLIMLEQADSWIKIIINNLLTQKSLVESILFLIELIN